MIVSAVVSVALLPVSYRTGVYGFRCEMRRIRSVSRSTNRPPRIDSGAKVLPPAIQRTNASGTGIARKVRTEGVTAGESRCGKLQAKHSRFVVVASRTGFEGAFAGAEVRIRADRNRLCNRSHHTFVNAACGRRPPRGRRHRNREMESASNNPRDGPNGYGIAAKQPITAAASNDPSALVLPYALPHTKTALQAQPMSVHPGIELGRANQLRASHPLPNRTHACRQTTRHLIRNR